MTQWPCEWHWVTESLLHLKASKIFLLNKMLEIVQAFAGKAIVSPSFSLTCIFLHVRHHNHWNCLTMFYFSPYFFILTLFLFYLGKYTERAGWSFSFDRCNSQRALFSVRHVQQRWRHVCAYFTHNSSNTIIYIKFSLPSVCVIENVWWNIFLCCNGKNQTFSFICVFNA